jgi:FkbM family methyltransferase
MKGTKFTSQVGQDKWVCKQLQYKDNGIFLDIGAYDGKTLSNTYFLEKELGWTGVCVEPGVEEFLKLKRIRDCVCVHKAIYNDNIPVLMDSSEMLRGIKKHLQCPPKEDDQYEIQAITMKTLLETYSIPKVIDYISLDTEGSEYEILSGFPFDEYTVTLWTIEHNAYLDGGKLKKKVRKVMKKNGYVMVPESEQTVDVRNFEDWFMHKNHNK